MAVTRLLRFYAGTGTDDRGRRLADIWRFSMDDLEGVHDYIQWLFPLAEQSAFNPGAPILDAESIEQFATDDVIRHNLGRSLRVMLTFYGLEVAGDCIRPAPSFKDRSKIWLTPHNHNYLRLTRILKSLALLGLHGEAKQMLTCLQEIYANHQRVIGPATLAFWRDAV